MCKLKNILLILSMSAMFVGCCARQEEAIPVVTTVPAVTAVSTVNTVPVSTTPVRVTPTVMSNINY